MCGCAGKTVKSLENIVPYLSASVVVIHYEEALYQVYAPYPLTLMTMMVARVGEILLT